MTAIAIFTASWCRPCQQLKKQYAKQGVEYDALDIDDPKYDSLSDKLGIESVPTVVAYVKGADGAVSMWELDDDSPAAVQAIEQHAVRDPRTPKCAIPESAARALGLLSLPAEPGARLASPEALAELLNEVALTDNLRSALAAANLPAPARKDERVQAVVDALLEGSLMSEDLTACLDAGRLRILAEILDEQPTGRIAERRRALARGLDAILHLVPQSESDGPAEQQQRTLADGPELGSEAEVGDLRRHWAIAVDPAASASAAHAALDALRAFRANTGRKLELMVQL